MSQAVESIISFAPSGVPELQDETGVHTDLVIQGFALANGKSVFGVLATDPARGMRFAGAMPAMEYVPGYAIANLAKVYDWASLGDAYIVNVGGQRGQIAIELARKFNNVKLLVQDSAMIIQGAETEVPAQLKGRVEFEKHELFETQTVQADVYFFRMVFRNWGDKYAVKILKAHIPALRPGVKILIQDVCMPEPETIPLWRERIQRYVVRC